MNAYAITIHDPDTGQRVWTLEHKVLASSRRNAVASVVRSYSFYRTNWVVRAKEYNR